MQVGSPAEEGTMLSGTVGADVSMQAHDREWSTLEGHLQAITSLAYTVDGMYMLSGTGLIYFSHAFTALFSHDQPVLRICALKLYWLECLSGQLALVLVVTNGVRTHVYPP